MYIQFYSSFALKNALSKSRIKFVGKPGSIIEECLSEELSKCSCFEYSLQGVFFPDIKMFHLTILLWYYQETNSDGFFFIYDLIYFSQFKRPGETIIRKKKLCLHKITASLNAGERFHEPSHVFGASTPEQLRPKD